MSARANSSLSPELSPYICSVSEAKFGYSRRSLRTFSLPLQLGVENRPVRVCSLTSSSVPSTSRIPTVSAQGRIQSGTDALIMAILFPSS